jgi:hypothetical protein
MWQATRGGGGDTLLLSRIIITVLNAKGYSKSLSIPPRQTITMKLDTESSV